MTLVIAVSTLNPSSTTPAGSIAPAVLGTLHCGEWSVPATLRLPVAATEPVTCATCELHAEAVFRVEGMDCNEEVVILERRLKPLTGLESVSADLIGQCL